MFERATRECRTSPQIATDQPLDAALVAADRQRVEQRLRRMFMGAVAGVDDRAIDLARQQMRRARLRVAHDDDVGTHGVERHGRVDQRLALAFRGLRDRHVHHVGAEPLAGDLERRLRAGRGLVEQIDLRAPAQIGPLLFNLPRHLDGVLGEIKKRHDIRARKALDPEQMAVGVVIWGGVLRHGQVIAGLWRGRNRGFARPIGGSRRSAGVRAALSGVDDKALPRSPSNRGTVLRPRCPKGR